MNTIDTPQWSSSDFIADDILLDFLNTTGAKDKQRTNERLHSSRALFDWALAAQLISEGEHQRLLQQDKADTASAGRELEQIILWREAVHGLMRAYANSHAPEAVAVKAVETAIKQALASAQLRHSVGEPGFWDIDAEQTGLPTIRHRLALHLNKGLTGGQYQQVKECEACTWLFIDTSRSRRRRWCSMSTCGNRAKARRFYQNENKM
ncbi:CGNR zinc finger domain-containing protein [Pseudomonas sp. RL_15y_Pfl2_60]|uniref:CGNR zinc finger domain-containing protein n=1 Tax=Pseudomonas sp. RL_15y_Pfl2_60 TaxID=3088709 RepID=UPI0030DD8A85